MLFREEGENVGAAPRLTGGEPVGHSEVRGWEEIQTWQRSIRFTSALDLACRFRQRDQTEPIDVGGHPGYFHLHCSFIG